MTAGNFGNALLAVDTVVMQGLQGVSSYQYQRRADVTGQNIEGVLVQFNSLGVTPGDTIFGFSLFGNDVTGTGGQDLLDPTTFPLSTGGGGTAGGLDLVSGGLILTGAGQVQVPGYLGSKVDAKVRSRSGARPVVAWATLDAPASANRRGTKVRLARVPVPETTTLVLAMGQGEGEPGEVAYKIRLRIPKKGPLIRR